MKIFKNKFFISVLAVALVLCIFSAVFEIMGVSNTVKTIIGNICSPFEREIWKIKENLKGYSMYFSDMDALIEENSQLKDEIADLKEKLNNATLTEEENRRLREYIAVKEAHADFEFCEALVIGSSADNYMSVIKINKGKDHGIDVNMPVIVATGLVGCVAEVGSNWANVRVICETSSGVGGYISRSGEIGIVQGDITYRDDGVCKLAYLDIEADVKIGDLVYTSGAGSVYPGGLLIGKVSSVGIDEYSRSKVATVTCEVDFDSLNYVMVVTSHDRKVAEDNANE